ncbi:MAG: patatin-like phospholipase family protein [Armatimonadota bacterium]
MITPAHGPPRSTSQPRTALVLCGGGLRGAVEVGFYRAIIELGLRVDLVVGTSIGAINGAFIAAGASPAELERLWTQIRLRSFFEPNWGVLLRGAAADSLCTPRRLHRFVVKHLPIKTFEELPTPLLITATDLDNGESVVLSTGDCNLIDAILASTAVPGIFPPVRIGRRRLADGGIVSNLPVEVAVDHGATRVLAMDCRCDDAYAEPTTGFLAHILRAFHLARRARSQGDLMRRRDRVEVVILEPGRGCERLGSDAAGVRALIQLAYETALHDLTPLLHSE